MRILLITDRIPYPPTRGAAIRIYNLLRRIAREHEVWIAAFSKAREDQHAIEHLLTFCQGIETVETVESRALDRPLEAIQYLAHGRPIELRHHHSQELVDTINRLVSRIDFDIVHIENSYMGLYLEGLPPESRRRCDVGEGRALRKAFRHTEPSVLTRRRERVAAPTRAAAVQAMMTAHFAARSLL